MLSFREMLCLWLPWHRFVVVKRLSAHSQYLQCSCGREFSINDDARVILPWHEMRDFHEEMRRYEQR